MCFGRKPRSVLTNIFNLKTEGKYLIESILNKTGNQLTQIHLTAKSMESIQKDRNFGKSAETEDLRKEMRRRKVSQLRFSIVEKTNRCALTSKFEVKIRKLVGETVHTVSDWTKTFHENDVAEVPISVANNQVNLRAKEIAKKVDIQLKNVKRKGRKIRQYEPARKNRRSGSHRWKKNPIRFNLQRRRSPGQSREKAEKEEEGDYLCNGHNSAYNTG